MFGKMINDAFGIVEDAVRVAVVPVSVAVSVTRDLTKPIADAATDAAKAIQSDLSSR